MCTFFVNLQSRSPSHQHQAYRTLKTFCRWAVETSVLREDPLRGFTMRTPKTLPDVPTDDELRAVLAACPSTLEGTRNRALILSLADSGLRASEVLRLLIEVWRVSDRGLFVRWQGPQGPRGLHRADYYSGAESLADAPPDAFSRGVPVRGSAGPTAQASAPGAEPPPPEYEGLPASAPPASPPCATALRGHQLAAQRCRARRSAAAAGHESLTTTLRYSSLVGADLQRAHRKAGAIERLRLDWPHRTEERVHLSDRMGGVTAREEDRLGARRRSAEMCR